LLHLTPASKGHTVGRPVPSLECCTLFRVGGPGRFARLAGTVVSSSRPRAPCGLLRIRNVRVSRTTAARAAASLVRLPSGVPAAGPAVSGRSPASGACLLTPPLRASLCTIRRASSAVALVRPGPSTDLSWTVQAPAARSESCEFGRLPEARRPVADSAKSRRTLTGR